MLLQFTVGNVLSFKDKRAFTMEASGIKDTPVDNIIKSEAYKVLRTAAVYGANSSGKSNFIKAFAMMGELVLNSVKLNDSEELTYDPFLLSTETVEKPTYFEIVYLLGNMRFRYGFENTLHKIVGEWLFVKDGNKKEKVLFVRNTEGIGVADEFKEGEGLEEKTNDNRLFLSLVAQLGGEISKGIIEWFRSGYSVLSGLSNKGYTGFSKIMFFQKLSGCDEARRFFRTLELGFKDINVTSQEFDESQLPSYMPSDLKKELVEKLSGKKSLDIFTIHKKYNKKGEIIGEESFNLAERESSGTRKLFDLAGPIFDTLLKGRTLIIDELDAKMHPLISEYIIKLFNDPKSNPNNAQLIFSTHDTHLLASNLLRRDQIWFTEKDKQESTDLYSIMDIVLPDGTKPRNDSNYEKNYINGRYGAIPYVGNY